MAQTSLRLLLVEENLAHVRLFQKHLARTRATVEHLEVAESLTEALEHLRRARFDLVVLDLSLPDAHGLTALQRVRETAPEVPVVVHSVLDDHFWIIDAIKQGAQNYLIKDRYDAERLNQVVTAAIELKWTQQSLHKDQHLRRIIETTSDGVVVVDTVGRILFFNQAAEHLLGWSRDDLLEAEFGFPLVAEETAELDIVRKDGSMLVVEMRITPIQWEEKTVYLASLRDITMHRALRDQLTAAKEKAEELVRLKTAFLTNMSHELRTPLTGILGFADVLMLEAPNEEHREFAAIIKQAGHRLLETINSVLTLSQLESGTLEMARAAVLLIEVITEVATLMQPLARKKNLTMTVAASAPDASVYGDRILLHRILYNLVGNAIKFTDQGTVTVELDADDEQVDLRVCDTGKGIRPAFIPHLFDEFRQDTLGDSDPHGGNGLGLAITKKLVTLMDGTIAVHSEVGVGTTFTVSFPPAAGSLSPGRWSLASSNGSVYHPATHPQASGSGTVK